MASRGMAEGRVRAGLFEIDLAGGELYKNGRKIALQQQPFRVLSVLIERPGEIVTREELQSKLWPSDTYVAFDEGLNTAIRKLRTAFGDSADNPRFIETVPRRGYRFIAPLTPNGNGAATASIPETNPAAPAFELRAIALPTEPGRTSERALPDSHNRRWLKLLATALLGMALLLAWSFRPTLPPPQIVRVRQLTRRGDLHWLVYLEGSRIYFGTGAPTQWHSVSVEGGESSPANEIKSGWLLQSFSPNGSELLVQKQKDQAPFWKVFFPSGSMQEVDPSSASGSYVYDGTWSPDGQDIAFAADSHLFVMKNDGSQVRKLATFDGSPGHPVWSPDGGKIRVNVDKGAGFSLLSRQIVEVDVATGATRTVPLGVASPKPVGWVKGGDYFIFTAREGGVSNLWAVRETSAGFRKADPRPIRLTNGPVSYPSPVIGRDGRTIFAVGNQARAAMQIYNRKTGQFEPFLGGIAGNHITYSRDGQSFAYVSLPEYALWRCRADGQDCRQLVFLPMQVNDPYWSPDGKSIAFNAKVEGKLFKGYIVSADGGVPQLLLPESSTGEERLQWSPDGKRIMYVEVSPSSTPRLRMADLATRQVTDVPDSAGLAGAWSPDGIYIVAADRKGKNRLFDFRTNRWTTLDEVRGDFWWSPDSQFIYFHTLNRTPLDPAQRGLFRMRLSDHHVEKVMGVPPFQMTGTFGVGTGMTPDGTPLVMKDLSTSDLYALELDLP